MKSKTTKLLVMAIGCLTTLQVSAINLNGSPRGSSIRPATPAANGSFKDLNAQMTSQNKLILNASSSGKNQFLKETYDKSKAGEFKNQPSLGGFDAGGAQSILTSTNEVKLLELATVVEIKNSQSSKFFENYFPVIQNKLGEKTDDFFNCSKIILNRFKNQFSVLEILSSINDKLKPVFVNFRLAILEMPISDPSYDHIPLGAIRSAMTAELVQEPVAAYVKGRLWIANPIYKKMDFENKCGVQIHESLRHLNYLQVLEQPFTTNQIENLTKYFIGKVESSSVENELSMLKNVQYKNLYQQTMNSFEKANQLFALHKQYSARIQNPATTAEEIIKLYQISRYIIQQAYQFQFEGMRTLPESLRTSIDSLNLSAQIIEAVLINEYGPWNTLTFEKLQE